MKHSTTYLLALSFAVAGLITGCGNNNNTDPEPDLKQEQADKIAGTWMVTSVTNSGDDATSFFADFVLTMNPDKTFTTIEAGTTWPASGSYNFKGDDLNTLVRSDGIEMSLSNLTATTITLAFTVPPAGGRLSGISGNVIFTLNK